MKEKKPIQEEAASFVQELGGEVAKELFRVLAEKAQDGIYVISPRGFEYINPAFADMTGFSAEEIISGGLELILRQIHPEDRERFLQRKEARRKGEPLPSLYELRFFTKSGRFVYLELNTTPLPGGRVMGVARNITEWVLIRERMRESELLYRNLIERARAGIVIVQEEKIKFANPTVTHIFGYKKDEIIGSTFCSYLQEEDRERIASLYRRRMAGGKTPSHYEVRVKHKDGRPLFVEVDVGVIEYQGQPAEILVMHDLTGRKKTEEELRKTLKKLRQAFGATISALNALVEFKDPYTAGHQRRVADLARSMAKELGLSSDQIDGLRLAASIHDIGKIVLPSEILSKPGHLTENEWNLVRTHPQIGYDILKDICFPWPIAEIIYQHHERLDGSGYPRRLKGEEIRLEARILAVADVVEAMSSHRPYRAAYALNEALAEIARNKGRLYDERVAEACRRLFQERGYRFK